MEVSLLIARIIAVVYVATGFAIVLGTLQFKTMVAELVASPALLYLSGALSTGLGLTLVHFHNLWVLDWRVIITTLGWSFLTGGLVVMIFPDALRFMGKFLQESRIAGIGMILIGMFFGYFGFWSV